AEQPASLETMQVTATREPVPVEQVPASVTIVDGDELRLRGARDLRTALSLVAGVEGTPTGDAGPAGSVPALWGLREADAFLLVVDGVPWGGAFNPATPGLDLTDVERIEILRGAAPVMYGATSFVGVIHVIHYAAGSSARIGTLSGGSYGSYGASASTALPALGGFRQSLAANVEHRGFSVDRQEYSRYHLLYRGGAGGFHADADVSVLPQAPGNVVFRNGASLRTDLIPADSNANPADAKLDQKRVQLNLGYDTRLGGSQWATTLSLARTWDHIVRGFLRNYAPVTGNVANSCVGSVPDPSGPDGKCDDGDADGYAQTRQVTDLYFDTHLVRPLWTGAHVALGVDYLYGMGQQSAGNFAYFAALDGSGAQSSGDVPVDETTHLEDRRHFGGLYAQMDWQLVRSLQLLLGVRLNHTREALAGEAVDIAGAGAGNASGADQRNQTRLSGVAGLGWQAVGDALTLYADYRNAYKPLAIDFGPEADCDDTGGERCILEPETSESYEVGARGRLLDSAVQYDVSAFWMDFQNLKTLDDFGDTVNGGHTRFTGFETEWRVALPASLALVANYAYHDSRFLDFHRGPGPAGQVARNRFEMAPFHLAGGGLLFAPPSGPTASIVANYVGERRLNKSNSLSKGGYTTLDASFGWRFRQVGVNLVGSNLTDRRDAVAESELAEEVSGASSYYLLPARRVDLVVSLPLP
ncbi:MAG TPA: TonB-dependent receptor, partial [Candidatus Binatia bacterium]|nr:TonB-dependent receptor [Candidatus Binatia bacterium]